MAIRLAVCVAGTALAGIVSGCSSPFDSTHDHSRSYARSLPDNTEPRHRSIFRGDDSVSDTAMITLSTDRSLDDYLRYALRHSSTVEAAYQRWLAVSEKLPQVRALSDPRVNFGFFLDEVEMRNGAQQSRYGVSQAFPCPVLLIDRGDAAALKARTARRVFEGARLPTTERVVSSLHENGYLDAAIRISCENIELLESFEEVVRAQHRVGAGSHPEQLRVQVELNQLEDRLAQLAAIRPVYVAELNEALTRQCDEAVSVLGYLPRRVATSDRSPMADQTNSRWKLAQGDFT